MATNNNIPNDETRLDSSEQKKETVNNPVSKNESAKANSNNSGLKSAAAGVVGAAVGIGGAFAAMSFKVPSEPISHSDHASGTHPIPEPAHFDGAHVPIAHDVNDNMSFNEAFAAARHEVGAGGVFPWNGHVYGTYYANEWHGFSDAYKQEFSNYHYNVPVEPLHEPQAVLHPDPQTDPVNVDHPSDIGATDPTHDHPIDDVHPSDVNVVDSSHDHPDNPFDINNFDDIHTVTDHDDGVSIINDGHTVVDGSDVDIVSPGVDSHDDVHIVDTNHDGDYGISVVSDHDNVDNSPDHSLPYDNNDDINGVHDLHDSQDFHDSIHNDIDTNDHLLDLTHDTDVPLS